MKVEKWFLQTWFISLMFTFSFFIVPFVVGVILLIMQMQEQKKLNAKWKEQGFDDIQAAHEQKAKAEKEMEELLKQKESVLAELTSQKEALQTEIDECRVKAEEARLELIETEDEVLLQSFGFYDPKYDLETSAHYKEKLEEIRSKQKQMVKDKQATHHSEDWTLDGSVQKGRVLNNNNIKLTLNSFNNECDTAISKVKFNNIQSIETRIKKSYANLNKINKHNRIEIKADYLALKLDELYLAYEYAQKVEEEKEEQRRIREEMKEEQRALKEIEAAKAKIEKEEKHFTQEITNLEKRLTNDSSEEDAALLRKIEELQAKLALLEKDKEDVHNREQNTRAGYVYIISNIGSFGEDVYKIGMTRRLQPSERVKELGDASVPFLFDTHALIFSQDAPALEAALHRAFHHKRLNKVNERKEFFRVSLAEIEEEVVKNHSEVVQFTKLAEAKEYRESLTKEAVSA